jgi:hypothetical protein
MHGDKNAHGYGKQQIGVCKRFSFLEHIFNNRRAYNDNMVYAPITELDILNLPPPSVFPPMATAKIASISILAAIVVWLRVAFLLTLIKAATATHSPIMT